MVGNHSVYFETIGFLGLLLEAVLPLPQLITNHQRHSVQGFRLSLLANWLGGDASKMFYYAYGTTNSNQLAPQFIMCVLVQTLLDICAGFQYYYYSYIYNGSSSGAGSSRPRGSSFQLPIFSVGSKVPSSVLSPSADQGRKGGDRETVSSWILRRFLHIFQRQQVHDEDKTMAGPDGRLGLNKPCTAGQTNIGIITRDSCYSCCGGLFRFNISI